MKVLQLTFFLGLMISSCNAFEDYELDLYDLVEEVKGNFYDFMSLTQDCSTADVRKAYRRLSLVLHPDKNKDPDAELQFRQLVGIYEILKNKEKKEKYDYVLENGLPDWRQAIYYYRKVRKLGLTESGLILLLIITAIHYAMIWAAYWERRFNIEEAVEGGKKKDARRKNHIKYNDELEEMKIRALESIQRPTVSRLIPCQIVYYSYELIKSIPLFSYHLSIYIYRRITQPEQFTDQNDSEDEEGIPQKKKRQTVSDPFEKREPEKAESCAPVVTYNQTNANGGIEENLMRKRKWENSDYPRLSKAMLKFPQGTKNRWEEIAKHMGFTTKEIMSRHQLMKHGKIQTQDTVIGCNKTTGATPQDGVISTRQDDIPTSSDWSKDEQKALELALTKISKTEDDRWSKISELVPGRSKAECIARYKYLAEIIKQKKSS